MSEFQPALALREHMLEGHPASLLEAILLFGVQNPNAEFTRMKKDGIRLEAKKVPMAKIIVRLNKYVSCSVPDHLPYREISMTEYRVVR